MIGEGTALVKSPKRCRQKWVGALSPCGLVLKPLCCLPTLLLECGVGSESKTDDEAKNQVNLLKFSLSLTPPRVRFCPAEPGPAFLWGNCGESPRTPEFLVFSPVLVEISPPKAGHMLERDELISFCRGTAGEDPSVARGV